MGSVSCRPDVRAAVAAAVRIGSSLPSSSPVVAAALSLPNSSSLTCRYRVCASGM